MSNKGNIDLERVSKSIETLSSVENVIHYVNFAEYFDEMENIFTKMNLEHANCIRYKEAFEIIYEDIDIIKRKSTQLIEALQRTRASYQNVEDFSNDDVEKASEIYKETPASNKIMNQLTNVITSNKKTLATSLAPMEVEEDNKTIIPPVSIETNQDNQNVINTVPIGITIGLTGIAGSIGAVAINEINDKKNKKVKKRKEPVKDDIELDSYMEEDDDNDLEEEKDDEIVPIIPQEIPTYKAVRTEREADKYYGYESHEDLIDNDEESSILDDLDD